MEFDAVDVEVERRADEVFDPLDDYARDQLCSWGTAFTSYEGLGEDVCAALMRRARAWRVAKDTMKGT
jgi:hypothetical protein